MRRATSALAWYERGVQLERTDPDAAAAAYRRAIAGRPDLADAHNNLGRIHHDRGELAVAEGCYARAIELGPEVALYRFNRGVALEDLGRADEAVAAYEQALALDPQLADAHYNLARQLEHRARASANELLLRRAVRHLRHYRELARASG